MKVLFLDIDGVLNSRQFIQMLYRLPETKYRQFDHYSREFCPLASSNLVYILSEVKDLKIVVSSTWRKYKSVEQLQEMFQKQCGIDPSRVIDKTPEIYEDNDGLIQEVARGLEIQAWLDKHPEVTRFCIVDDDGDMEHLMPHLVQTSFQTGLMIDKADEIVRKLTVDEGQVVS